ncbi:MAG TPA: hypothetical protein VE616_06750 [Candidatus Udaeobacter sp.]|jgi:hypothetical protein|nr:hypothetical protein [Candidatus Udaeobacter sp.]
MAENILLWGFYCAAGGSVLLFGSIIQNLLSQPSSIPQTGKNATAAFERTNVRTPLTDFRGYDSPELFEEDLILRIEQLENKIARYNRKHRT